MHRLLQILLMRGATALSPPARSPLSKITTLVLSLGNFIRSICERTVMASSNTDPNALLPRRRKILTSKILLGYWTDLLAEGMYVSNKYIGPVSKSQKGTRVTCREEGKLLGVGKCNLCIATSTTRSRQYMKRKRIKYTSILMRGHQQSGVIKTREARHRS